MFEALWRTFSEIRKNTSAGEKKTFLRILLLTFLNVLALYLFVSAPDRLPIRGKETIETRISKLSESLLVASRNISDIEKEIEDRRALVRRLQSDAEVAERLKALNSSQVAAVAQALRGQIEADAAANKWSNYGIYLIFAIVGAVCSELIGATRRLWQRRTPSPIARDAEG